MLCRSKFLVRFGALLLATASGFGATSVNAETQIVSVVRVEEDWELYIGTPDSNSNGPQISCTFSPVNHVNGWHAVFELNHQSLPAFVPGGLQLQIWNGSSPHESRKFPNTSVLATTDEVVRWTQTMQVQGNMLTFEIIKGESQTWANFGGQGYLKYSVAANLANLNDYNPEVSVANSSVGYASNRVKLLVLRGVRYHLSTGQVIEDTTVRLALPTDTE